jgi:hypothetical protein
MSIFSIKQYQSEVEKMMHFGGTKKETSIHIMVVLLIIMTVSKIIVGELNMKRH